MRSLFLFIAVLLGTLHCNFSLERSDLQLLGGLGLFPAPPVPPILQVGGEVSGLTSRFTLALRVNTEERERLEISTNGVFQFSTILQAGNGYSVQIVTQPPATEQSCRITDGSEGVMGEVPVTNLRVVCDNFPRISSFTPTSFSSISRTQEIRIRFNTTMNTTSCAFSGTLLAPGFVVTWETGSVSNDTAVIRPQNTPNNEWNLGVSQNLQVRNCTSNQGLAQITDNSEAFYFITSTTGAIRFVATTGTNTSNTCESSTNPCQTIEYAYSQLAGLTSCATNLDCAVLVQSGTYNLSAPFVVTNGRSVIGSFNSSYSSRDVFNNPTIFSSTGITGCGGSLPAACRTIEVTNVATGTRLETIRVTGKDGVNFSHGVVIGSNSSITLRTVVVQGGSSATAGAISNALFVEGTGINLNLDAGVYSTGVMDTSATTAIATAIRINSANGITFTAAGAPMVLREAGRRHGLWMTNTSPTRLDIKFASTLLDTTTPINTIESYGMFLTGNLAGVYEIGFMNVRSFQAVEKSIAFYWDSTSPGTATNVRIYNNQFTAGRITSPSAANRELAGIKLNRFSGYILNNTIIGGSMDQTGTIPHSGIWSIASNTVFLYQNTIASGSGSQIQRALELESGNTNFQIRNNNFAANTNPSSNCVFLVAASGGHVFQNNNFHSCSGGHVRIATDTYFRSNCAGEVGQEGNLSTGAGCATAANRLSTALTGTVSGNIDMDAGFTTANPTDPATLVTDWNLRPREDGTTPCVLSRGGRSITGLATTPFDFQAVVNRDRRNQNRTLTDTTGILNLPADAAGISIGSYEYDGICN